jgi:hypothetical protein
MRWFDWRGTTNIDVLRKTTSHLVTSVHVTADEETGGEVEGPDVFLFFASGFVYRVERPRLLL